jgi:hypothetical protein
MWRRGRSARRSTEAQRAPLPRPRVQDHRARMLHMRGLARRQWQACHRSRGCHSPIEYRKGRAGALRLPSQDAPAGGHLLVYRESPPGGVYPRPADNSIAPQTRSNAPSHQTGEGASHGCTPFVLPPRSGGPRVALRHAACGRVSPRNSDTTVSDAHPAQAHTLQGAQTVCRSDAQTALCPV